ncbi:MAG: PilZ domain-containing protein [Thermodesulfobacteriota bacterium]
MTNTAIAMLLCPHCGKTSNVDSHNSDLRCSECGMEHTGSDAYMRCEGRLQVRKECTVSHKKRKSPVRAIVRDISFSGAMLQYTGPALSRDTILILDVEGLDLHVPARVMWTHSMTRFENKAGVKFVWPF